MQNLAAAGAAPPYFDALFERLQADDPAARVAFGRHVHWGCWSDPTSADGSPADYARAAEELCRRVCRAARVHDGQSVLDVGCGFGGTIASLNEGYRDLDLVGVNIDPRQLQRAEELIEPANGNRIRWVEADACQLPFPAASFDVLFAVECIFHFPSRATFFAEAARILRPGGILALSDFVPTEAGLPLLRQYGTAGDASTRMSYGHVDLLCPASRYRELAAEMGLRLARHDDVTQHTLPTYDFLRSYARSWADPAAGRAFGKATARLETASRMGWLRYSILSFTRDDSPAQFAIAR